MSRVFVRSYQLLQMMLSGHQKLYVIIHLPPGQNGRHIADDLFKRIFWDQNIWFSNKISLKYFPWGVMNNMAALVHIMAWRPPGDIHYLNLCWLNSSTHICGTRGRWVIYVLFKNAGNSIQRTVSWWPDALKCKNLTITKVPYMTLLYIYGNINWYGCWRWQVINHLCSSCYTNRIIHSTSPCSIDQQQVRLSLPTSMSSWWVHLRSV